MWYRCVTEFCPFQLLHLILWFPYFILRNSIDCCLLRPFLSPRLFFILLLSIFISGSLVSNRFLFSCCLCCLFFSPFSCGSLVFSVYLAYTHINVCSVLVRKNPVGILHVPYIYHGKKYGFMLQAHTPPPITVLGQNATPVQQVLYIVYQLTVTNETVGPPLEGSLDTAGDAAAVSRAAPGVVAPAGRVVDGATGFKLAVSDCHMVEALVA